MKKRGGETKKAKKAAKDPNKPKRPPSAFFVFMYDTLDSRLLQIDESIFSIPQLIVSIFYSI